MNASLPDQHSYPVKPLTIGLFCVMLFLTAWIQYGNTLGHDYAWDDKVVITENPVTKKGLKALPTIFKEAVFVKKHGVYRPVPQALFALEYQFGHGNPFWGHFFNVFWFALTCIVVFFFVKNAFPTFNPSWAFAVAMVFAVHPLHVEVVANIKSRDEILGFLFGLMGLMALAKSVSPFNWKFLILGVIGIGLGVLSKFNSVTLLGVLPFYLWYAKGTPLKKSLLVLGIPALIVGVGYLMMGGVPEVGTKSEIPLSTEINNSLLGHFPEWDLRATAVLNLGRYVKLFCIPHPLIHIYGYAQIPLTNFADPWVWVCVIGLLAGIICALWGLKKRHPAAFGFLFFLVTISIYSNLFVRAPDTMADRYMYLPSLGLAVVVIYGLRQLHQWFTPYRSKRWIGVILGIVTVGFLIRGWIRNVDWKDDGTLAKNSIVYMENNALAQANLGYVYLQEARSAPTPGLETVYWDRAETAFERALEIYPDFPAARLKLIEVQVEEGDERGAVTSFQHYFSLDSTSAEPYAFAAHLAWKTGATALSDQWLTKALELDPQNDIVREVEQEILRQSARFKTP